MHKIPAPEGTEAWEEFNRIVWSAQESSWFAMGMVNGYFDNNVPMDFWKLLALFVSSNTLSSAAWAALREEQRLIMVSQAEDVLSWYDNMNRIIPSWYEGIVE